MVLNLKIEILKIFSLELNFTSDKEFKLKKEKLDEKDSVPANTTKQPTAGK